MKLFQNLQLLPLCLVALLSLGGCCSPHKPVVHPLPPSQPVRDAHDKVGKNIVDGKKKIQEAVITIENAVILIDKAKKSQEEAVASVAKVDKFLRDIENYLQTHESSPEVKAQIASTITELATTKSKLYDLQKWVEEAQVEIISTARANTEAIKKVESAEVEIRALRQSILPEYTDKVESQNQTLNDVEKRLAETKNELSRIKAQSIWRKILIGISLCVGVVIFLFWFGLLGASKLR